jgi:hypothetical protein
MSCVDLGASRPLDRPEIVFRMAIRADLGPAEEFAATNGMTRAFFPITGGVLKGEGIDGKIIPGGADWALRQPDGSYAIQARYLIRLTDGTVLAINNAGRMVPQADGAYLGRTCATFEVPAGIHEWLGKAVFFGTAMAEPDNDDHVFIELWEALI